MTTQTQSNEAKLGALGDRLRTSLQRVQRRGGEMLVSVETRARERQERLRDELILTPRELRQVLERAVVRFRQALDIPSRSEMLALGQRLEQIDRKLRRLEEARTSDVKKLKRNIKSAVHVAKQAKASKPKGSKPKHKNGHS